MNRGQTMAGMILSIAGGAGVSLAFVYNAWIQPLQANTYVTNGNVQALTASVSDIQKNTEDLPELKAEVDYIARLKGYNGDISTATST